MSDKKPTDDEMAEFQHWLAETANTDIIPQMKRSAFCMVGLLPGEVDAFLALQVGIAIMLEKPLLVIALGNAWVPQRLRQLADAVVEGASVGDPAMQERLREAMGVLMSKRGATQ